MRAHEEPRIDRDHEPARVAGAADHGRIYIFDGSTFDIPGTQFSPFGDLWAYSVASNRWSRLASSTPGPSARSGAVMWVVGDQLYVFGGIDASFTTLNDLWTYNLVQARWRAVTPSGPRPPPRHVAQAGGQPQLGRLTLYGGEQVDPASGFVTLGDTWQFDLGRRAWRDVTPAVSTIDPARDYGAAAGVGTSLYLHGGDISGGEDGCGAPFPQNPTDQLWRFDLIGRTWHLVSPAGDPLVRLKRHAAASVDGRMFVVSGWDFRCEGGTGPGQIWNLDTFAFTPA
jgi:Galactose oxidase, central domain/Kelch motif